MKKFLYIFFPALSFFLIAQQAIFSEAIFVGWADENHPPLIILEPLPKPIYFAGWADSEQPDDGEQTKRAFSFSRRMFELGIDAGAGFDNNLFSFNDIFTEIIEIDMNKITDDIRSDGLIMNIPVGAGLSFNIMNIKIGRGLWDIGFFSGVAGNININLPRSLFYIFAEGNFSHDILAGNINTSGAVYSNAGLNLSAAFGRLRLGITPAVFSPLVFIPRSGINFLLRTEDYITLSAGADINVYSPFFSEGDFVDIQTALSELSLGFDLSIHGEYRLFPFLDIGGSISSIPLSSAAMRNRTRYTLLLVGEGDNGEEIFFDEFVFNVLDLADGSFQVPSFDFRETFDLHEVMVMRPFRFDVYARYRVFGESELLTIRPNIGFTVDMNNRQGYFNTGVGIRLSLQELLVFDLATNFEEAVWKHSLGFTLNLRLLEFAVEAALRSERFTGGFKRQGFGLNAGVRIGW